MVMERCCPSDYRLFPLYDDEILDASDDPVVVIRSSIHQKKMSIFGYESEMDIFFCFICSIRQTKSKIICSLDIAS